MNATQYERMRNTGIAPCGCEVAFEEWDGSGIEHQTVMHTCDTNRQAKSDAANEKSAAEHAERNERNMLLRQIPLSVLREMVHGKPAEKKAAARA